MSSKKFYETAEFKKTQKEWAKKLEASGFEDIEKNEDEYVIRPQEFTIPSATKKQKKAEEYKFIGAEARVSDKGKPLELVDYTDYIDERGGMSEYEYHNYILREFEFKRPIDKAIFTLFTEGKTEREISAVLPALGFQLDRSNVRRVIDRILDGQEIDLQTALDEVTQSLNKTKDAVKKDADSFVVKTTNRKSE